MANDFAHRSALVALLLDVTASCGAMAEPRLLADAEMDAVTAAGVVVEVSAYAGAVGASVVTRTGARALTVIEEGIEIGAGFAEGQAYACCGKGSSIAVGSGAAGDGDVVYGDTFTHVFHGAAQTDDGALERFTFGYSAALLLAVSSDAMPDFRELDDALGDLSRKLVGSGQTLSGDGLVTGFAFAPVYVAGMRWRAARYLTGQHHDLSHAASRSEMVSRRLIRAYRAASRK